MDENIRIPMDVCEKRPKHLSTSGNIGLGIVGKCSRVWQLWRTIAQLLLGHWRARCIIYLVLLCRGLYALSLTLKTVYAIEQIFD